MKDLIKKNLRTAAGILPFLLCYTTAGYSREIGKLRLTPTAFVEKKYDSNVFKQRNRKWNRLFFNDSRMNDYITIYSSSLSIDYPIGRQNIFLSGTNNYVNYDHYRNQDYESHSLEEKADLKVGDGFFVNQAYNKSVQVIPRTLNFFIKKQDFTETSKGLVTGGYKGSWWEFSAGFNRREVDYRVRTWVDRKTDSYDALFNITPYDNSRWYVKFQRKEIDYDLSSNPNDNRLNDFVAGTSYKFTGKSSLKLEAGRREKDFSQRKQRNFVGFIGKLQALFPLNANGSLSLTLSRTTNSSYFRNTTYYIMDSIEGSYSWMVKQNLLLKLSAQKKWQDYRADPGFKGSTIDWQRYLILTGAVTYVFYDNFTFGLSYNYQERSVDVKTWDFNANQVSANLSYSWR
ncbi:MAG: hypothetical protein ACE5GM_02700 [bacterium]